MNYTENYHLPQWEETDRIMRTDFNQMCADIDQGIREAQSAADTAQANAGTAQAAAGNAQATADTALSKANKAFCPDLMPYKVGSYVGTGKHQMVSTGFKPSFIIISGQTLESESPEVLLATGRVDTPQIHFHIDYVDVYPAVGYFPQIDLNGRTYHFIAFR